MKILPLLVLTLVLGCATQPPAPTYPPHQTFTESSVDDIQSALINRYMSANTGWTLKEQSPNSLVFSVINDSVGGMIAQSIVSGPRGSPPVIEHRYTFATVDEGVRVYPFSQIIFPGFGRQDVQPTDNNPLRFILAQVKEEADVTDPL